MRKLLNKPWFVGLLALSAIAFVVHALLPARELPVSSEPAVAEVSEETAPEPGVAVPTSPAAIRAALKDIGASPSLHDPFAPRAKSVAQSERAPEPDFTDTVKVSAVWIQDGKTYVLINEQIFKVGQRVGRFVVESANREGVWVSHWKGRDFVTVGGAFTLTTPSRQAASLNLTGGG